jgi:hypothetical protein
VGVEASVGLINQTVDRWYVHYAKGLIHEIKLHHAYR